MDAKMNMDVTVSCNYIDANINMKVALDAFAYPLTKGHETDAGFDIRLPSDKGKQKVSFFKPLIVDTGVYVDIPEGYVGFLKSKSGLNVKSAINGEGVIDAGYTGSIKVKLYRNSFFGKKVFEPGDKIIQLVILPIPKVEIDYVDSVDKFDAVGSRKTGGFGSTGR